MEAGDVRRVKCLSGQEGWSLCACGRRVMDPGRCTLRQPDGRRQPDSQGGQAGGTPKAKRASPAGDPPA